MKAKPAADGQSPAGFFREIEIEFLIHELKDPLAVIETGLRTILDKRDKFGSLTERQERILKRTLRNSNKARAMLNSLLEVGRSEAGCYQCCRFDPVRVLYSALLESLDTVSDNIAERFRNFPSEDDARAYLLQEGIAISIEPAIAGREVFQDEIKFRQIVGNLIKNALQYRRSRMELRLWIENEQLQVEVIDDGPGIDPSDHQLVFQRYRQACECGASPRRGHGLGLAGALVLARCLGGDIRLQSHRGSGTSFRLHLPFCFQDLKSNP
jgi:signal transduction histidine kinase